MTDDPRTEPDLSLPGASISMLAVERESGDELASTSPDRALAPASNTKLVTAALALDRIGPKSRFETRVFGEGTIDDRSYDGDIVLGGTGAPDLCPTDLASLAEQLGSKLDQIDGDLLVDGGQFSGGYVGPGWTHGDRKHAYGAPSSGVAVSKNQVTVTVTTDDGRVSVSVTPESEAFSVDVDVTPETDATTDDLTVYTDPDSGTISLRGSMPPNCDSVDRSVPVLEPEYHCGLVFESALAEVDVVLSGTVRVLGENDSSSTRRASDELVSVRSEPIRTLIREMNVPSDNFVAEQLARRVAYTERGEGSWESWEAVVRDHFESLTIDTFRFRDGSGLSRYNLVPARGLIEQLRWVDDQPWADDFFDSLPTPGEGTISSRLRDVQVAAKTGTITGSSALTGVVRRSDRDDIFFSLLYGGLTSDRTDAAREKQDEFVRGLAGKT